jgi:hypothetical protein
MIGPWYVLPPDEWVDGASPEYPTKLEESSNLSISPISLMMRSAEKGCRLLRLEGDRKNGRPEVLVLVNPTRRECVSMREKARFGAERTSLRGHWSPHTVLRPEGRG